MFISRAGLIIYVVADIGDSLWYGGPEELIQHFPLRKENNRSTVPYVPGKRQGNINLCE